MKKLVLAAVVILLSAFTALTNIAAPPEFKFEKETHDFGKIPQGKPVSTQFKFTNMGDEPLIISAVEPNCTCIAVKFTTTPVIKGATGTIDLTYDALTASPFNKIATVKSNARTPIKYLYVRGEVVAASSLPKTGK